MSVTISFELSDEDIQHFVSMAKDAQKAVAGDATSAAEIAAGAKRVFEAAQGMKLPEFIAERLGKLEVLARMVTDDEWRLPEEDLKRVLSAMAYFSNPEDLIPDRVPGIGFLDDAIMAELVVNDLAAEIDAYNDFCAFRSEEEKRRADEDQAAREEWLAPQREVLHKRIRHRRSTRRQSGGWKVGLW